MAGLTPDRAYCATFREPRAASQLHRTARQCRERSGGDMGESAVRVRRLVTFAITVVILNATAAQGQWLITPYLGGNISGGVEQGKGGPGVSVGYFGGVFEFEFDFQRYQHFFKDSEVSPLDPGAPPNCTAASMGPCTDIDTDAMSFM